MKILAISLLRLGDLFMHQELFSNLRTKYSPARIDLVINSEFSTASDLFQQVDMVHLFPRKQLQQELVETSGSFFRAFAMTRSWLKTINLEGYDLVIDLTHNFLSAKLLELIEAKEKLGSHTGYFNDVYSISSHTSFHYLEALKHSLGLAGSGRVPQSEERKGKHVLIQPYTSDRKKDWDVRSVKRFVDMMSNKFTDYEFSLIGAPFEEKRLRADFDERSNVKIEILSLAQLQIRLWEARLLVSGDTATVHLAAQCRTPMFGLYLGSADPFQTAPWIDGAYVLQSQVACTPCRHSSDCSQPRHLCGESLSPEMVSEIVGRYLLEGAKSLSFEAQDYSCSIYRQVSNGRHGLVLEDLSSLEESVRNQVRQLAWLAGQQEFQITKAELSSLFLSRFQSEGESLANHVRDELVLLEILQQTVRDMEVWLQSLSKVLVQNTFAEEDTDKFFFESLIRDWQRMSTDHETNTLFADLLNTLGCESDFAFYKKARWTIGLISQFTNAKKMIYVGLRNLLRERGYHYVTGPGKLS